MQENVAKNGWELTKVARIGRSRSLYGQKRVEGGVGQSREPKLSVCCLHIILPTRFWPRNDRELPFLAIAQKKTDRLCVWMSGCSANLGFSVEKLSWF